LLRLSRPAKEIPRRRDARGHQGFFADPPEGTRAIIVYGEGSIFRLAPIFPR